MKKFSYTILFFLCFNLIAGVEKFNINGEWQTNCGVQKNHSHPEYFEFLSVEESQGLVFTFFDKNQNPQVTSKFKNLFSIYLERYEYNILRASGNSYISGSLWTNKYYDINKGFTVYFENHPFAEASEKSILTYQIVPKSKNTFQLNVSRTDWKYSCLYRKSKNHFL